MKTKKTGRIALLTLIGMTTLAIWAQSLLSAVDSRAQSEAVKGLLSQILGDGTVALFLRTHIRKVAHFTEFALLGAQWSLYGRLRRRAGECWLWTVAVGVPVAITDELLQLTSEGRAAQMTDVLLDSSGYLCGYLLVLTIFGLLTRLHRKSLKKHRKSA